MLIITLLMIVGTLVAIFLEKRAILQLHEALAPWEDQAIQRLLASPTMNVDKL